MCDNTTVVCYINKMGGTETKCNSLTRQMWDWCCKTKIWLVAGYLPGVQNVKADEKSRSRKDNMNWQLCPETFLKMCNCFGTPEIDLFANRLNHQLPRYYS